MSLDRNRITLSSVSGFVLASPMVLETNDIDGRYDRFIINTL